jgi:hypothetical protein
MYKFAVGQIKDFLVDKQIGTDDDVKLLNKKDNDELISKTIFILIVLVIKVLESLINGILILNMIHIDFTLITIIFAVFTFMNFLVKALRIKFRHKNKSELYCDIMTREYEHVEKDTIYKAVCRLITLLYWGYALYILIF